MIARSSRSFLPWPRTSLATAAARNPLGAVTAPGTERNFSFMSKQSCSFAEAAHEVHALHSLASGAFGEIVFGAENNESARTRVESPGDLDEVGGFDVLRVRQRLAVKQPHE